MKWRLLIFMIILMVGVVNASDIAFYELDSTTIIEPGEVGTYTLRVSNLMGNELNVQLQGDPFAGLPSSTLEYVRVDPNIITLKGYGSEDVEVEIKLKEDAVTQKRYKTYVTATVLNMENVEEKYNLQVFAKEPEKKISMYIKDYPESVEPGKDYIFTIRLENNVPESLGNVNVYVSSELFEEHQTIQLFESQEREIEFSFPIESTTPSQEYIMSVRIFYEDELQSAEDQEFMVEINEDVSQTVEDISNFLLREISVTKTNNGNFVVGESYNLYLKGIEKWFAKYSIRPTLKDSEGVHWSFNLEPGESYSINIRVDYRPIVIALIVVIVFALLVWYWMSRGVVVRKEVFKLRQTSEGISDFKILLHVKNNTNRTMKNLMIIEMLPRVINPLPRFGTLRPNNVQKGEKGVRMIWRIPELVKGEERIISYDVEAKMKIIGQFMLPQTLVKFRTHRNRVATSRSNRLSVVSGFLSEGKKR